MTDSWTGFRFGDACALFAKIRAGIADDQLTEADRELLRDMARRSRGEIPAPVRGLSAGATTGGMPSGIPYPLTECIHCPFCERDEPGEYACVCSPPANLRGEDLRFIPTDCPIRQAGGRVVLRITAPQKEDE